MREEGVPHVHEAGPLAHPVCPYECLPAGDPRKTELELAVAGGGGQRPCASRASGADGMRPYAGRRHTRGRGPARGLDVVVPCDAAVEVRPRDGPAPRDVEAAAARRERDERRGLGRHGRRRALPPWREAPARAGPRQGEGGHGGGERGPGQDPGAAPARRLRASGCRGGGGGQKAGAACHASSGVGAVCSSSAASSAVGRSAGRAGEQVVAEVDEARIGGGPPRGRTSERSGGSAYVRARCASSFLSV